jgi:hypothetical protein
MPHRNRGSQTPSWSSGQSDARDLETAERLTTLEVQQELRAHRNEERWSENETWRNAIQVRMTIIEKALLAMGGGLYVALQDKFPGMAKLIRLIFL